jgi:predicted hydrocarbon binding protein
MLMPHSIDLPANGFVALTRDGLLALRAALFRDMGATAAAAMQEAGYAGGGAVFDAFARWLQVQGAPSPEALPAAEFSARAAEFCRDLGWGPFEVASLDGAVAVDTSVGSEADPSHPLEFPGCYFTAGTFAEFFGRLAGQPLAVMEVECRSMGAERCRFLIGTAETMQHVYDEMGRGVSYVDALHAPA